MTHPVFGDIETLGPWTTHIQTMDLSLAEGNPDASVRAWRLAYSAALSDRGWRGLLAVATASIRLRALPGLAGEAVARARETYWIAFFRARQQSSLDGVLSAAATAPPSSSRCASPRRSRREPEKSGKWIECASAWNDWLTRPGWQNKNLRFSGPQRLP